jgi:molybdenum cofactor synthesis domain-containing protein
VLSTGNELVDGTAPLLPGKIRDSNRPALLAQLASDGFAAIDLGRCEDRADALLQALQSAADRCDAVLTSGGVSVGDHDIVRDAVRALGGEGSMWLQVAVKPAKPFAFCTIRPGRTPVFGLPGNPVSAMVSYELFARPALRLMAGYSDLLRPVLTAVCDVDYRRPIDGKLHLVRVSVSTGADGALHARPSGGQGSHQLRSLAAANALALVRDGTGLAAGDSVEVWLLDAEGLSAAGHPGPN